MNQRATKKDRGDGRGTTDGSRPPAAEPHPALPAPGSGTAVASGAAGPPRPVLPVGRPDDRPGRDGHDGDSRRPEPAPAQGHGQGDGQGHDEDIPRDLRKPETFWVIAVLAGLVILLGVLFAVGLLPRLHRNKELSAESREAGEPPVVNLTRPRRAQAVTDLVLPGNVLAWQDTGIYARITGYVREYRHDLGDSVKQGDLLAVIDAPDIDRQLEQAQAQLGQSRASLQRAEADVALQEVTLRRFEDLFKIKAVNEQQLNQQQAAAATARSNLDQTRATIAHDEANVRQFEQEKSWEQVTAPFDGRITARNVQVGQLIMPGTTASNTGGGREMFHMAATDVLRVMISVPQTFVQWIEPGQPADVFFRDDPGHAITGKVTRFAGALDQSSRTLLTEVDVPNPNPTGTQGALTPGMYLQVKLSVRRNVPPLMVPESALIFNADDTQLALVKREGDKATVHFQHIAMGRDTGAEIEVGNGLGPDDLVVTNPGERLVEGGPVKVAAVKTPPPPSDDARKGPGELGTPGATPVKGQPPATQPASRPAVTPTPPADAPGGK